MLVFGGVSSPLALFLTQPQKQMSNEKQRACWVYLGDEVLPSFIGIIS